MGLLKKTIVGGVIFVTLLGSAFSIGRLIHSAPPVVGEIGIKTADGQRIGFDDVPIFVLSESEAGQLSAASDDPVLLSAAMNAHRPAAVSDFNGRFALDSGSDQQYIAAETTQVIDGETVTFFWLGKISDFQIAREIVLDNNNLTHDFLAGEASF